jgi:riboflavin synthase
LGDSIAVNGVCLTISDLQVNFFIADIMPVTFHKSNLGMLKIGSNVNLERAMSANGRFSGHFVNGHIDCTAKIVKLTKEKNSIIMKLDIPFPTNSYLVQEGSIALDGVSLTIAKLERNYVTISLIPHTYEQTILCFKKVGNFVNVEADILGKYILQFLSKQSAKIDKNFLVENGF